MLPFLQKKKSTGLIVEQRNNLGESFEDTPEARGESEELNPGLIACAHDLISAMNAKDSKALAMALKAAFEICDSEPHVEGEHVNSYDELNAKAAEGQE